MSEILCPNFLDFAQIETFGGATAPLHHCLRMRSADAVRVAESEVKCPTPTFPNFLLLKITWMKFGCQQFCSNKQSIVVHSKNSLFQ